MGNNNFHTNLHKLIHTSNKSIVIIITIMWAQLNNIIKFLTQSVDRQFNQPFSKKIAAVISRVKKLQFINDH